MTLVTNNISHFSKVLGLKIENWISTTTGGNDIGS